MTRTRLKSATLKTKKASAKGDSQSVLPGGEEIAIQQSSYRGEMVTLFPEIKSITDNFDKEVIRPSKATACSQVHLVRKSSGGWRFTMEYRALNKVITNKG